MFKRRKPKSHTTLEFEVVVLFRLPGPLAKLKECSSQSINQILLQESMRSESNQQMINLHKSSQTSQESYLSRLNQIIASNINPFINLLNYFSVWSSWPPQRLPGRNSTSIESIINIQHGDNCECLYVMILMKLQLIFTPHNFCKINQVLKIIRLLAIPVSLTYRVCNESKT